MRNVYRLSIVLAAFLIGVAVSGYLLTGNRRTIIHAKRAGQSPVSWPAALYYCVFATGQQWPWPLAHLPLVHRERDGGPKACPVLWQTPNGRFWGRGNDGDVLNGLFLEQYVDGSHNYRRPECTVEHGDVVVDAGSHLGTFTKLALDQGAAKVIAFEPDPTSATCFRQTFEQELANGRVILVPSGLWSEQRTLLLHESEQSWSDSIVFPEKGPTVDVPVETLDNSLARLGITHVDFVKMDIEGAERYALRGAQKTISSSFPKMAIATEHYPDDAEVITKWVKEANPAYTVTEGGNFLYCYHGK